MTLPKTDLPYSRNKRPTRADLLREIEEAASNLRNYGNDRDAVSLIAKRLLNLYHIATQNE